MVAWIAKQPAWLEVQASPISTDPALERLDAGERAAILLAEQQEDVLLLIDDADGRLEATKRRIPTMGTLGVLRAAALQNMIDLPAVLRRLQATNFRVSTALMNELLAEPNSDGL